MPECKWCGEDFKPGTWPGHCSEACLVNDMMNTFDEAYRQKLQDQFEAWLDAQERELAAKYSGCCNGGN